LFLSFPAPPIKGKGSASFWRKQKSFMKLTEVGATYKVKYEEHYIGKTRNNYKKTAGLNTQSENQHFV